MQLLGIFIIVLLSSLSGTWLLKKYAVAKQIIDIPNARSSHKLPTPRGGGMAFVVVFLLATIIISFFKYANISISILSLISMSIVALLGFYDDKQSLSPLVRCVVQLLASVLAIYSLMPLPDLSLYFFTIPSGIILNIFIVIYLVWLLNLYNFMDGINGIASVEAVSVCLGMLLIFVLQGHLQMAILPAVLLLAVLGFLPWNFPKAQIFMGDAGSSFLGFVIGLFSLQAFVLDAEIFWSCLVLLGVFIVDASVTISQRALRGERIYQAHCSHAYQQAAKLYNSHTFVTFAVLLINIFWLLPIALLISLHYLNGFLGLLLAYSPLILTSIKFKAGKA